LSDYLHHRIEPHNAFFTGIPGRSVAQIGLEQQLRGKLSDCLQRSLKETPPARHLDLLRALRRKVRSTPEIAACEAPPRLAWAVRYGDWMMRLAGLVGGVLALIAGAIIAAFVGLEFAEMKDGVVGLLAHHGAAELTLMALGAYAVLRSLAAIARARACPDDPVYLWARGADATGAAARIAQALAILCTLILATRIGVGPRTGLGPVAAETAWIWLLAAILAFFIARFVESGAARQLSWLNATSREAEGPRATAEIAGLVWVLGRMVLLIPLFALIDLFAPNWTMDLYAEGVVRLTVFLGYIALGVALLIGLKALGLAYVHLLETTERTAYVPAQALTNRQLGREAVWAREENGPHRNQNHFASVTLVKPGIGRQLILRAGLAAVNFVGRFRNYSGTLGGIPTIHSARWLLLDRGRRLVFLTNYVGAWDSYLNEFSELDAVSAVNAGWSNTYVCFDPGQSGLYGQSNERISFPKTRYLFGKGARQVPAFKAYVRQSQIRTRVWYGAYPDLSVPTVNANSDLRRMLFAPTTLAEREEFLRRV
ncbi:MAG: hypothetical protein AAFR17_20690, partial [Pseudomonadota bacterium]